MVTALQLQYLQLLKFDSLPPAAYARLLRTLGTLGALRSADVDLFSAAGIDPDARIEILTRLDNARDAPSAVARQVCKWLDQSADRQLLCFEQPAYPSLLKEIACPPPVLFVEGNPSLLDVPQLAIVGSRKASRSGGQVAHWLARELAAAGFCVTSGLAAGIDSQAHRGAIAGNGQTLAILGTGIDRIYPAANRELAQQIAGNGALVSEFPLGTPPLPGNFPQRNRIIAGLSLGVIVVEAAPRSGSLITARLAMEANREVFAVPGSIFNGNARGCHYLIREGAKLVDSVDAILEELQLPAHHPAGSAPTAKLMSGKPPAASPGPRLLQTEGTSASLATLADDEQQLLQLLGADPCPAEVLAERAGMPIEQVCRLLAALEIKGLLVQGGGRFQHILTELP